MRVDPDDAEAVDPAGEALCRSDVCAAAPTEDDRPRRKRLGHGLVLLVERVALDDSDLRIRERDASASGHSLAPGAPRGRDTHQPGRERAPAAMALVAVADRDRGERSAARTAGAKRAPRNERVERVRENVHAGQRHGRTWILGLVEPVDPDRRDPELRRGRDVVEEALSDMDVADIAAHSLTEDLPVLVGRLVRADFARDDRQVEANADRVHRGVDQIAVGVREDPELPAAVVRLREARDERRRRPASPAAIGRARSPRPRAASSPSRRRAPRARS